VSRTLWQIELAAPPAVLPVFEAALEPFTISLSSTEQTPDLWRVQGLCDAPPDRGAVEVAVALAAAASGVAPPEVQIARLEARDWVRESLLQLPAVAVGRFRVRGSHLPPARPPGIDLLIDAGLAFGTGHHPTTWGCLAAIDRLTRCRRLRRPLDMGCGSGILALALASVLRTPVVAADNDPAAVQTALANARINRLAPWITGVVAEGFRSRAIVRRGPYDLIVANILARPLIAMAPALAAALTRDGIAVLSGLLGRSEPAVLAAYRAQGLHLVQRIVGEDWHTLILVRRRRPQTQTRKDLR